MRIKLFFYCSFFFIISSCLGSSFIQQNPRYKSFIQYAKFHDFTQKNRTFEILKNKWDKKRDLKIRFFGDSHIAGDFISNELRNILGNINAIGFSYPLMPPHHQTFALHYMNENFQVFDSQKTEGDFPMGGVIATPKSLPATIELNINPKYIHAKNPTFITQIIFKNTKPTPAFEIIDSHNKAHILQASQTNQWEIQELELKFPITISATNKNALLGGYFIYTKKQNNIIEHLGINGARSDIWLKWNKEILEKELEILEYDIIMLCYGSNDSMYRSINEQKFMQNYQNFIALLKKKNPNAIIILISPPPVLFAINNRKNTYRYSKTFTPVKQALYKIAQKEQILLFDMQEFINKTGSKIKWVKSKLSKKDVHLTSSGYYIIADGIYEALQKFFQSH